MFELSTELLPYFFVLQTLMMEGVVPWVDLSGLLIGYVWEVRLYPCVPCVGLKYLLYCFSSPITSKKIKIFPPHPACLTRQIEVKGV